VVCAQTFGVITMRVDKVEWSGGGAGAAAAVAVRGSASVAAASTSGAPPAQPKHAPFALDLELHNLLLLDHHTFEGQSSPVPLHTGDERRWRPPAPWCGSCRLDNKRRRADRRKVASIVLGRDILHLKMLYRDDLLFCQLSRDIRGRWPHDVARNHA
jgi:hypothetical protein